MKSAIVFNPIKSNTIWTDNATCCWLTTVCVSSKAYSVQFVTRTDRQRRPSRWLRGGVEKWKICPDSCHSVFVQWPQWHEAPCIIYLKLTEGQKINPLIVWEWFLIISSLTIAFKNDTELFPSKITDAVPSKQIDSWHPFHLSFHLTGKLKLCTAQLQVTASFGTLHLYSCSLFLNSVYAFEYIKWPFTFLYHITQHCLLQLAIAFRVFFPRISNWDPLTCGCQWLNWGSSAWKMYTLPLSHDPMVNIFHSVKNSFLEHKCYTALKSI